MTKGRFLMSLSKIQLSILYMLVAFIAFTLLSSLYDSNLFMAFDQIITSWVSTIFPSEFLPFFIFITDVGSYRITLPILFIVVLYLLYKREYLLFVLAVLTYNGVRSINHFLKGFFERDRPPLLDRLVEAHYYSFPSGHSMNSIAFYGLLCWLLLQLSVLQNKKWRVTIISLFSVLILFIGLSRIYLRVHYPTDVIGGFLAGSTYLVGSILIFRLFQRWLFSQKEAVT
jgi:undecaprenyl-diphosphatase